jgi:hypothetical protein
MVAVPAAFTLGSSIDVLALLQSIPSEQLGASLAGFQVRYASAATLLHEVQDDRPRVVLLEVPPADAALLKAVAALRRRRPALRSVVVWAPTREGNPRTVDVHVRWLRAKLERNPEQPVHLVTVRGHGYRLEPEAF